MFTNKKKCMCLKSVQRSIIFVKNKSTRTYGHDVKAVQLPVQMECRYLSIVSLVIREIEMIRKRLLLSRESENKMNILNRLALTSFLSL